MARSAMGDGGAGTSQWSWLKACERERATGRDLDDGEVLMKCLNLKTLVNLYLMNKYAVFVVALGIMLVREVVIR